MNIFGLTVSRQKQQLQTLSSPSPWAYIHDWTPGAWQKNLLDTATKPSVLAFSAVYACVTLIAGDIAKLRLRLMENQDNGTWQEVTDSPFLPVMRKPNQYQTRVQFIEAWIMSKLIYGNSYPLKERDKRGVVNALHVLDSRSCTPLVATNGDVFYRLKADRLAQIDEDEDVIVPASELIHDRMICFWHPLIGVSPLFACLTSALQGVNIQKNAQNFFKNMSRPSGVLTAPGKIGDDTAKRIKEHFANFSGDNVGGLAVLGDGLTYEPMTIPPIEAQLIEQLGWTVGDVARAFHVPPYKLGLNTNVTFSNAAQLDRDYYSQCLQTLIEAFEVLMDDGLSLPAKYRTEFDLDDLMRMDPLQQAETNGKRIGAGELAPNEARLKGNLPPVKGGETPYLQQQNYSLAALAKRDAQADPFGTVKPEPAVLPAPPEPPSGKEIAVEVAEQLREVIRQERAVPDAEDDAKALADALIRKFAQATIA